MKKIFKVGVVALVSLFFMCFFLFARSFMVDTQLLPQKWFSFEPDEEFELKGSRYFVEDMKQMKFYPNVSAFLRRMGDSKNSLGIRFSWDRIGNHFVDIVPKDKKYLNNSLKKISMWVWGGNYQHELGLIFTRDSDGFSYAISFGKLDYYGWKSHVANVPMVNGKEPVFSNNDDKFHFDRFRIYSDPKERVDNIYVFFDNLTIEEEVSTIRYDGSDLGDIILKELNGQMKGDEEKSNGGAVGDNPDANQNVFGDENVLQPEESQQQ